MVHRGRKQESDRRRQRCRGPGGGRPRRRSYPRRRPRDRENGPARAAARKSEFHQPILGNRADYRCGAESSGGPVDAVHLLPQRPPRRRQERPGAEGRAQHRRRLPGRPDPPRASRGRRPRIRRHLGPAGQAAERVRKRDRPRGRAGQGPAVPLAHRGQVLPHAPGGRGDRGPGRRAAAEQHRGPRPGHQRRPAARRQGQMGAAPARAQGRADGRRRPRRLLRPGAGGDAAGGGARRSPGAAGPLLPRHAQPRPHRRLLAGRQPGAVDRRPDRTARPARPRRGGEE